MHETLLYYCTGHCTLLPTVDTTALGIICHANHLELLLV